MEEAACQQHAFPSRHPPRRKSPWGKWRGFSEQILMKLRRSGPRDAGGTTRVAGAAHAPSPFRQHVTRRGTRAARRSR
ncbi:hypothetical protein C6P77_27965 [Burkholderia ambifaria]|nr:hypothetical protein C6P77_27965 [Burkholderia ambifaria]